MPRRTANSTALPAELTSFVGRRAEIAETKRLLRSTRLVTLLGAGGVGKTRLALQVATALERSYAQGVHLIELTDVSPDQLADVLGESPAPDRDMLLVIDNCEHLIEPLAAVVDRALRSTARLRVLATSRAPLGIRGEHTQHVRPLTVPPEHDMASAKYESVRLLIDRARAAGMEITEADLPVAAELCRRLEGLPLAVELAARRLSVFKTLPELLAQLDRDRFRLLAGGAADTAPRHQRSLHDVVSWSYELCSPTEQVLWARLSVFSYDVDLPAAEAVC